jgi:RNA polymerase sigma factor (sigma-70 family)
MMVKQHGDNDRAGEWQGFDQRFRGPLIAYFQRRIRNRAEAEDLTQEVFMRLARRPDQNNGESIEAYVFKIAGSVLVDWSRHQSSRRHNAHRALSDISENLTLPAVLVEDRTPERVLEGKEALKGIEDALAELSERTRYIFLLSRLEHVPHRDIADLYSLSVSAVEKHVMKAVAHISRRVFQA